MRRLFVHIGTSLDGYIDDATGSPVFQFGDGEFQAYLDEMLESIDGMVFGRTAYEQLASYWPNADGDAPDTQVRLMHELPKYVLSRGPLETPWNNSHPLGADPVAAITELKAQSGKDLAVFAGAGAARFALTAGVVDEVRLAIHPALLRGTRRLFDADYPQLPLRLTGSREFPSGVLVARYEVVPR